MRCSSALYDIAGPSLRKCHLSPVNMIHEDESIRISRPISEECHTSYILLFNEHESWYFAKEFIGDSKYMLNAFDITHWIHFTLILILKAGWYGNPSTYWFINSDQCVRQSPSNKSNFDKLHGCERWKDHVGSPKRFNAIKKSKIGTTWYLIWLLPPYVKKTIFSLSPTIRLTKYYHDFISLTK